MSTISSRFSTVAQVISPLSAVSTPSVELTQRLSSLYALSQRSQTVFGSPLGPFFQSATSLSLPRFVYFGPETHDESLRLAFHTGFDRRDLRGSVALLHFVEKLTLSPDLGQGLNLSFFPLVDVVGLFHQVPDRRLGEAHWAYSNAPEIDLLQKDARGRGYHGFVRIQSSHSEEAITARLRGLSNSAVAASGIELISSEDFEPWPVRWEAAEPASESAQGLLSIVDDLPVRPFELTLEIPASWTEGLHREAVTGVLKNFILRYRSLQAYSQHL